jgi:undecaprenyl-diphosphatase
MNIIIFRYLNSFALHSTALDTLIIFCGQYLGWLLFFGALAWFAYRYPHPKLFFRHALLILLPVLFAWAVSKGIKLFHLSSRPFTDLSNIRLLPIEASNESFPSGHATLFSALAASVGYIYWKSHKSVVSLYIIGALAIGLARIVGGVHWPVDVLAGWILGGGCALLAHILIEHFSIE